jgi:hypothetical protein
VPGRVIYLDVDDEITSAASRIRSAEGGRVAVVLPHGSRVATSRINFRLLARDALVSGDLLFGAPQCRQQQGCQDSNDRHDHEQFDERKSWSTHTSDLY